MICSGMCNSGQLLQHYTAAAVPSVSCMQFNAMFAAPRQGACLQQAHARQAPSAHTSDLSSIRQPRELAAASTPASTSSSTSLVSQKTAAKKQVSCLNLCIPGQVLSCAPVWTDSDQNVRDLASTAGRSAHAAMWGLPLQSQPGDGARHRGAYSGKPHRGCWHADTGAWPGLLGGAAWPHQSRLPILALQYIM